MDTLSLHIVINLSSILQPLDGSTYTYCKFLAAAFGETEDTLITVTASGRVLRWCIPCKRLLDMADIRGSDGQRRNLSRAWLSRDGSHIAWTNSLLDPQDNVAAYCDRLTGGEFAVSQSSQPVTSVSFSHDGEYFVVLSDWGVLLHVCRTRDGTCVFADRTGDRKSNISLGGFLPEQRVLAYGIQDGKVGIVRMRDVDSED